MTENPISLAAALTDAWDRMQTILFRPFDLKKWMVLGFTAWLAGLAQGGKGFSWNTGGGSHSSDSDLWASASLGSADSTGSEFVPASSVVETRLAWLDWPEWPDWGQWSEWSSWPFEHPLWFVAGAFGCLLLLALLVVILWVSSRGRFMFLDNVVHNRAEVVRPWHRYRNLGNSLFGFQLAFYGLFIAVALGAVLFGLAFASGSDPSFGAPVGALLWIVLVPSLILVGVGVLYIQYFLDGFVVPLMYRYDLGVLDAWRRFGKLFRRHPWVLLLSGLFLLLLTMAAVMGVLVAGLLTFCIGFVLMVIPYIGTVLLLPIPVTFRGFTVALLDQIDPGYFPDELPG